MKSIKTVTNLSNEKLESMFNLCIAFKIDVIYQGITITEIHMDEMCMGEVEAKYYEESIRESFHQYVEMYAKHISI